ncbi:MAG: response regulator, partial [Proteobacteria bacterium]|nr:response regulator [Pseudomonadota bacterium]
LRTEGDIEQISEREKVVEEEEIRGGDETILLVDDEDIQLDTGQDILGQCGYTTITAGSGEEAIEVYEREGDRIALVIMDVGMPGMGGHRCLQELLKINLEAKVIITSGYSPIGKVKETLEAGAAGFIGKPYHLIDMLKKVRKVLDKRQAYKFVESG